MTARYLITLAMVLGLGTFAGCAGGGTEKGDDDDTVGDDDDDFTGTTGETETGLPELTPTVMTINAQFGLIGGTISNFGDGTNEYSSVFFISIGDDSWDYNDPYSPNYCTVIAPIGGESSVLDAEPIVGTAYGYNGTDVVETDCHDLYTLPKDFAYPEGLVINAPDWALGFSGTMSADMQQEMTDAGVAPADQPGYLGNYWNVPLFKEPVLEIWYGFGWAVDGGGVMGAELVQSDIAGQAELPDGAYVSVPLYVIPL